MRESEGFRTNPRGAAKAKRARSGTPRAGAAPARRSGSARAAAERERTRSDPKGGELCLSRAKPEETLVEARSGPDVQIGRQT